MDHTLKKPAYAKSLLIGLVSIFSAVVPLLLGVAPGFFAHLLYTGGIKRFMPAIVVSSVGSLILFGPGALYAQAIILTVAILMSALIRKRAAYFEIALFAAGLITLALYLSVSLRDIIGGAPTFSGIQAEFRSAFDAMTVLVHESEAAGITSADMTRKFIADSKELVAMLPIYMPATLCSLGALFGLFNLVIAIKLNRRARADMKPMSKFILWRIPKSFMSGALVLATGVLVAGLTGISALDAVLPAVMAVIAVPLMVQGLSLYVFLTRMGRSGGMLLALVILLMLFSPISAVSTLAVAGLLEQLLHIRRRTIQGKEDKNK